MYDRNGKSQRILTQLRVLDYEYICDRLPNFIRKYYLLHELLIFKYWRQIIQFPYSVTYFGQALGQDNAPAHRARETVHLLTKHRTSSLQLCGQSAVLTLTQSTTRFRGSCRSVCTAAKFVTSTSWSRAWSKSGNISTRWSMVINEAVRHRQWRPRLRACVRAHGGHFEHRL